MQYYVAIQTVPDIATGNVAYNQGQVIDQDEYNLLPREEQIHFKIKETVSLLFDGKLFNIPVSSDNLPVGSLYCDTGVLKIVLP